MACRTPVFIDPLLDDPGLVRRLAEADSPHFPVQRYASSTAEDRVLSNAAGDVIGPNFRGDWASRGEVLVPGAEQILHHDRLVDGARRLFGQELVVPQIVYANFTWQLPFTQGGGHLDVPAFRGFDRDDHPVWLLLVMGHSRLFDAEQVTIATSVAWFYDGSDGGFEYWPDGPDADPVTHEGDIDNTACVGDNDRMYHRVRPVGTTADGMIDGLSLDSTLAHREGARWEIRDGGGAPMAELAWSELRVSVSWKAYVFADADEQRRFADPDDPLTLAAVVDRFHRDLTARGVDHRLPDDPEHDHEWVRVLAETYLREPAGIEAAA